MVKMNVWKRMFPVRTYEGAVAQRVDVKTELRRTVLTCLLWEDAFYEKGNDIAKRITELVAQSQPEGRVEPCLVLQPLGRLVERAHAVARGQDLIHLGLRELVL